MADDESPLIRPGDPVVDLYQFRSAKNSRKSACATTLDAWTEKHRRIFDKEQGEGGDPGRARYLD